MQFITIGYGKYTVAVYQFMDWEVAGNRVSPISVLVQSDVPGGLTEVTARVS